MKTQAECWQALLDGEILQSSHSLNNDMWIGSSGELETRHGLINQNFRIEPNVWSIKPKTKTITKEQLEIAIVKRGTLSSKLADNIWEQL